jgi:hypothetical protein
MPSTDSMSDHAGTERHSLVPLDLAAEVIRQNIYTDRLSSLSRQELLDSIATTISVVATIYEYKPDGHSAARPLSRLELNEGMFKGGAKELRFIDGRAPRRCLAVNSADIADTIEALRA